MKGIHLIACLICICISCESSKSLPKDKSFDTHSENIYSQKVHEFSYIPIDIIRGIKETKNDSCDILNEFEGKYLNQIFEIPESSYKLAGKKIIFYSYVGLRRKSDYFKETLERYDDNTSPIGGSSLYILNEEQKAEIGGYDVVVTGWFKRKIQIDKLIKRLKR